MLIRLIPPSPHPTVLFTISFPNLAPHVPVPNSWNTQLQTISYDDLEVPRLVHALDKSAALPTLLYEVTFDVPALTISCVFVDGSKEEWPLIERRCLDRLEKVAQDVEDSAEDCRERKMPTEGQCQQDQSEEQSPREKDPGRIPTMGKFSRHKKQRSMLMSLVSSLVSSASHSSLPPRPRTSPHTELAIATSSLPSAKPKPTLPSVPVEPPLSPRALRRRARSTLVDAFRRHVLSELSRRSRPHGVFDYHLWISKSMLRRAEEHLAGVLKVAGLERGPIRSSEWEMPSPFFDDEDENASDDTDGSSLHTPTSTLHTLTPPPSLSSSKLPPSYALTRELATRLYQLISETEGRRSFERQLERERHAGLEIRSRRKAWLNGIRVPNTTKGSSGDGWWEGGFAIPFRRSPLGTCVIGAEDLDLDTEAGCGSMEASELFPVSEEMGDENEEVLSLAREMELELGLENGFDLESGISGMEVEVDVEILRTRPHFRPRTRTRSMSMPPSSRGRSMLRDEREWQPPSTPLLYPALPVQKPTLARLKMSKAEPDFEMDSEFTLAMDLPFSVRADDAEGVEIVRRRRRYEQESEWLTPGMPVRAARICR